ncbi:TIGR03619 family F420-dependent LLM class oxidoreductase [Nocardioides sp. zg-DK7169]|uniref:TIGR03619 family F420-dependent LLM class oxidoreductase n=1 Tax=Nocardioides sp. zg-DK7169 TaxID=2736600 RepID=UPI0015543DAC|nr:TIGR03619 family F420-dependent LLM class oxidoreductase [Nocardioides sp. zg-DK7169]NPC97522.1 TIGR03619 family F420-dependent LLM class oxidoreductase [Nocardioides sp. zg-DK7169]
MHFSINTAFMPTEQLVPIARTADELGYHGIAVPDHVVDLETLRTPYPYTPDGSRRWALDAQWPDPWVLVGALAAVTTRLRFVTTVYVPALRNPLTVAKSVGTAAVLSGNRVALGVGIGWCEEEFELLGQDFRTRGRRTDEALALCRAMWTPGMKSFEGEFHSVPPLAMEPTPTEQPPIYVGGLSEVAFRRAARHDGWVGDMYRTDEAIAHATRLAEVRRELGRTGDFEVLVALTDAYLPEHFVRAREGGVTECMTMPWAYYHGMDAALEQKLEGMRRFADDVLAPLAAGV